jgi:hypothetical protein
VDAKLRDSQPRFLLSLASISTNPTRRLWRGKIEHYLRNDSIAQQTNPLAFLEARSIRNLPPRRPAISIPPVPQQQKAKIVRGEATSPAPQTSLRELSLFSQESDRPLLPLHETPKLCINFPASTERFSIHRSMGTNTFIPEQITAERYRNVTVPYSTTGTSICEWTARHPGGKVHRAAESQGPWTKLTAIILV